MVGCVGAESTVTFWVCRAFNRHIGYSLWWISTVTSMGFMITEGVSGWAK